MALKFLPEGLFPSRQALDRIRMGNRRPERVAGAPGFARDGFWTSTWWGLAPDGSLLMLRSASTWGIYAFDWEAP